MRLALLALALCACGDGSDGDEPEDAAVRDGELSDAGSPPSSPHPEGGGPAAPDDGGGGLLACGDDGSAVSESCAIEAACDEGTCAGGVRYFCTPPGLRPDLAGCLSLGPAGQGHRSCCPPACVRYATDDAQCAGGGKRVVCPQHLTPGGSCSEVARGGLIATYCCS